MILLSRLFMLLIVVVLLVFCMSNLDSVTVKLVGWESPPMPLFLILLFVFFFGFFLALFWQALRSVTMKREFKPSAVITSTPLAEKEKKDRSWGLKKKGVASTKEQKEEPSEEQKSDVEKDSMHHADESDPDAAIEDK